MPGGLELEARDGLIWNNEERHINRLGTGGKSNQENTCLLEDQCRNRSTHSKHEVMAKDKMALEQDD